MTIRISEQVCLLMTLDQQTTVNITQIAKAAGISSQALANIIQGKSENPRLKTLQALCQYYGISLDYFACESKAECEAFLYKHQMETASELVFEIEHEAAELSPKGQRNVLNIMEWMRRATAIMSKNLSQQK